MKYSVIIPAYNAEKTISNCLNSILNQSLNCKEEEYEVIVVDDGSIDSTVSIARSYGVRVIQQNNQGPAIARNNGAKVAKGKLLIFTDSDCEFDYKFLENITAPFKRDPEIVGVQGSYKTRQREFISQFIQVEIETRYEKMLKNEHTDFIGTYAAAYSKEVFEKYGGFDVTFPHASGEDAEFSYKLHKNGYKMVFEKNAFVYHQHPSTLRKYIKVKFYRGFWRAKLYRKHPQKTVNDSYTPQSLKFQVLSVPIFIFFVLLSLFYHAWVLVAGCIFIQFVFFSLPFFKLFKKKNYSKKIFIPFMLLLRATALFFGLIIGIINELYYVPAHPVMGVER